MVQYNILKSLVQVYKLEWVQNRLLPKIMLGFDKQNGFLFRQVALNSLRVGFLLKNI